MGICDGVQSTARSGRKSFFLSFFRYFLFFSIVLSLFLFFYLFSFFRNLSNLAFAYVRHGNVNVLRCTHK